MTRTPRRRLHTDRPDLTAALRQAAWTYSLTRQPFAPRAVHALVQQAREGMGLPPLQGGAVSDQVQRRTTGTALFAQDDRPVHYEGGAGGLVPPPTVRSDWRFLNAPDHAELRLTARQGQLAQPSPGTFRFSTRGSHLPTLKLLSGPLAEVRALVDVQYADRRGLYLLRRNGQNYVGQTREFGTRGRSHGASGADHVLFAFPHEPQRVGLDTLNVAESLAIVSLAELLTLENATRGHDAPPQPHELREGAGFALAFVAAVIRWAHDQPGEAGAFLAWRTDVRDLARAYLSLQPHDAAVTA